MDFRKVNRMPSVQAAVHKVAKEKAARMQQVSDAAGGTATFRVRSGIRPGGRAFANIEMDNPSEEFGTSRTKKIGALRRIAMGG